MGKFHHSRVAFIFLDIYPVLFHRVVDPRPQGIIVARERDKVSPVPASICPLPRARCN